MGMHFGVDYYPEHWPRERWKTDAKLMQEMGVQVVRMAELSWFKLEPRKGEFHFEWLEEVIALLDSYGIKTILGTSTVYTPAWVMEENSEFIATVQEKMRYHVCQSNTSYREHIRRFVTAFSGRFAKNPSVIGWQIDCELGNLQDESCICDSCKAAYQKWLEKKYGNIESLNASWGTAFWGGGYNSFSQIKTPHMNAVRENPSAMLDWKCFRSDLNDNFVKWQTDIIRENCPSHFITYRNKCFESNANEYELCELLDFASSSSDFVGSWQKQSESQISASYDMFRSYKKQPFWNMQQQTGMMGLETMGRAVDPGQMSAWAMQSVAHGADAVVFWRWRTCAIGTEQYWHGILGHSGRPGRVYEEAKALTHRFAPHMEEFEGSMPRPEVAIVHSLRQKYAFQIQPNHADLCYAEQLQKYYKAFFDKKIPVDFVQDMDDLSKYKLVVAPLQYLMTPELEQHYIDYVANGGHLILTMRTGVKDANNICMTDRELPGRLGDICGIEIPEYDCLFHKECAILYGKKEYKTEKWADIITLTGAKSIAEYTTSFYKETPAITENEYERGKVWYVGSEPSDELMADFMEYVVDSIDIKKLGTAPEGVELMTRENDGQIWLFVINHTNEEKVYKLNDTYKLLEGEREEYLKPYEVQLFAKNKYGR